jgi:hypothetical protein
MRHPCPSILRWWPTNTETDQVVSLHRAAGLTIADEVALDLVWPIEVFSLSHVALPIAPDDPIYGSVSPEGDRIFLGRTDVSGERGLLAISYASFMRQRYIPFYSYMETRVVAFLEKMNPIELL